MDDVGKHIFKTQEAFTKATNQLRSGRGNVVSQVEKLKNFGVASKKTLPASMSNFEEDFVELASADEVILLTGGAEVSSETTEDPLVE